MPRRDEGFFSARDNTRLYWQSLLPDGEPGDVVGVVHGFGDHSGRYRGLYEALAHDGHAVIGMDHRGHGRADGKRGHCSDFGEFLDDMEVFWARVRQLASGRPAFILAHSHGGLIATHFVSRKPEGVKGLVMTCPYYRTATPPSALLLGAAKVLSLAWPSLALDLGLKPEMLSRDPEWVEKTKDDPLYCRKGTARWGVQHMRAQEQLSGLGSQITLPVLMLTGERDPVVSTPAAKGFFDTLASRDKTYKEYPGMLHEILNEVGKEEVLADISRWLSTHR